MSRQPRARLLPASFSAMAGEGVSTRDDQARQAAAGLDRRLPGWFVYWSGHRRRFFAIGACTKTSTILDEPDLRALLEAMEAVQLAAYNAERAPAAGVRPLDGVRGLDPRPVPHTAAATPNGQAARPPIPQPATAPGGELGRPPQHQDPSGDLTGPHRLTGPGDRPGAAAGIPAGEAFLATGLVAAVWASDAGGLRDGPPCHPSRSPAITGGPEPRFGRGRHSRWPGPAPPPQPTS